MGAYNHKVSLRYQDRFFDNETRFLGTLLLPDVRTTPLGIRYSASYEPKNLVIGAYAGWEVNTCLGSDNDPENYQANREGGDRQWNKFTGGGHLQWVLPGDFQFKGRFNGQYSDQRLIPGEQFGIGGSGSVRGYEGREVTGDYGIQGSLEAWSPLLFFDTQIFVFGDAGLVRRHAPHPGTEDRDGISSIGVGLHWNWKGYLDASCEVAHALENAVTTEAGDTRFLYQIFLRY